MEPRLYKDRKAAGLALAERLKDTGAKRPLVLAIPRGGVPVAIEIAKLLECPFDTLVVRKIGTLFNPEFAVGAVGPHDIFLVDESWLKASHASRAAVEAIVGNERQEMRRRAEIYKSGTQSAGYIPDMVILVDDGIATGLTARAAILAARERYPKARVVFATPLSIGDDLDLVRELADELVCLDESDDLYAISQAYDDFPQLTDEDVLKLLKKTIKE